MVLADNVWTDAKVAETKLMKLHRRLGHTKIETLADQLILAYPDRDGALLRSVARKVTCEACELKRKALRRPMVALPKEPHFNYEVGADLWFWRGYPVLHVICLFTRLRHCALLQGKTASEVCHSLLHLWIKYYGPPLLLYTDLGREFDNDLMRLFVEKYGITLHCAPGGAHCSLWGVDRQKCQLQNTVELVLEADDSLSLQDACDVACLAANYHPMADRGFSPQQLLYGVSAR